MSHGCYQTARHTSSDDFDLTYDAENRLVEVEKNNATIAQFVYNGDGQKVKSIVNGETIYLVNGYYEKKGSEITKYYLAGASRVAMRKYTIPQSMEVEYMLGDHLGSTSVTTDNTGAKVSEMRYKPWGEIRYSWTSNQSTTPAYKLPVYTFTGQRSYMDDPSTSGVEGFGLMDYNARMYDPAIGRFISADTVVPGGVQGLDRYAYVNNSPVRYTDPTGHMCSDPEDTTPDCEGSSHVKTRVGDRMISGNGFFNGAEWTVQGEFDKRIATRGHLAAIQWLAGMYGITLPTGVTWVYTEAINTGDGGVSPTESGCDRGVCLQDNHVYITDEKFQYGDFSVVLATLSHEAEHAWLEDYIEGENNGVTPPDLPNSAGHWAIEWQADEIALNSGLPLSPLARSLREQHQAEMEGKLALTECANKTAMQCIDFVYINLHPGPTE